MVAVTTGNDVLIALFASMPATIAAVVTLITVVRGRARATAAHDALTSVAIATHEGVANVAEKVGAEVPPIEPSP